MNATISPEATAPLVEFIYEAIAVLESDLIMIGASGVESVEDIDAFKVRYPFAFQARRRSPQTLLLNSRTRPNPSPRLRWNRPRALPHHRRRPRQCSPAIARRPRLLPIASCRCQPSISACSHRRARDCGRIPQTPQAPRLPRPLRPR